MLSVLASLLSAELLLKYAVDVGIAAGHEWTKRWTLTLITRHQLRYRLGPADT